MGRREVGREHAQTRQREREREKKKGSHITWDRRYMLYKKEK